MSLVLTPEKHSRAAVTALDIVKKQSRFKTAFCQRPYLKINKHTTGHYYKWNITQTGTHCCKQAAGTAVKPDMFHKQPESASWLSGLIEQNLMPNRIPAISAPEPSCSAMVREMLLSLPPLLYLQHLSPTICRRQLALMVEAVQEAAATQVV